MRYHSKSFRTRKRQQRALQRSTPAELSITRMSHDGRGIQAGAGKTSFVFGALPGETWRCQYIGSTAKLAEYHAFELLSPPHPEREAVFCRHYSTCGGCQLQHLKPAAQRQHKQNTLLEHWQHLANTQPRNILPALYAGSQHYRHKARLGVKYLRDKDEVILGFRKRHAPRHITRLHECHILAQPFSQQLPALQSMLQQLEAKASIAQVEVSIGEATTVLTLRHLQTLNAHDQVIIQQAAAQHNWRIDLQPNPPAKRTTLYQPLSAALPAESKLPQANNLAPKTGATQSEVAKLHYTLPDFDLHMQFAPQQFTQINPTINRKMLQQAIALLELKNTDICLDLFCGIGNFSLPIARHCHSLVGVEAVTSAVTQAKHNAHHNKLHNTTFYCWDLTQVLPDKAWVNARYHKLVLDPPRCGAAEIIKYLPIWKPEVIVYISCNTSTLARDSKAILEQGYILDNAGIVDMFPHTQHIESMAQFRRI